jgi:hypothetical protein
MNVCRAAVNAGRALARWCLSWKSLSLFQEADFGKIVAVAG